MFCAMSSSLVVGWLLLRFTLIYGGENLPIYNSQTASKILLLGLGPSSFLSLSRKKNCSEKH